MRLLTRAASPLFLIATIAVAAAACTAACTAEGSSTTVTSPPGSSGAPAFPGTVDDTSDAGTSKTPASGPTDYAALFGPPASTNTTPGSINGLWAGTDRGSQDTRVVLSATSLVIAKRCSVGSSQASGITVTSRITTSSIKTLESKMAPGADGVTCGLDVKPAEATRCTATTDTDAAVEGTNSTAGCFFLGGTTLNFYGTFLDGTKLTKLSD